MQSVLKRISEFNDKIQELIFLPNHLAPTFPESEVVKPPRFNAYYDIEDIVPLDVLKRLVIVSHIALLMQNLALFTAKVLSHQGRHGSSA